METGFVFVWAISLAAIAVLLVLLGIALRRQSARAQQDDDVARGYVPARDTLIFYHENECVRSTLDGRLWLRIPGIAWDASWRSDLLRVEVRAQDPDQIVPGDPYADAQVIAAYDFLAFRMTETGGDLDVRQFVKPVGVAFLVDGVDPALVDVLARRGGEWQLVPCVQVEPETLGIKRLVKMQHLAAVSVGRLDPLCVVRRPPSAASGELG
ncbi:MAG: hypothetical protein JW934_13840 [Anaerolineae bacterium]|nr:hypothetical protein [Anaerolineae bacterium]